VLIFLVLVRAAQYRAEVLVPDRMKRMEKYIKERDFDKFAQLTMEVRLCIRLLSLLLFSDLKPLFKIGSNCIVSEPSRRRTRSF
jgi:hypothetical protein